MDGRGGFWLALRQTDARTVVGRFRGGNVVGRVRTDGLLWLAVRDDQMTELWVLPKSGDSLHVEDAAGSDGELLQIEGVTLARAMSPRE